MHNPDDPYDIAAPIAERYHDLQGIPHLQAAWDAFPVERASRTSALKAAMHAAQIALFNMEDLKRRAACDLQRGDMAAASAKQAWESRFSRVLNDVSRIPDMIAIAQGPARGQVSLINTPAFDDYFAASRALDEAAEAHPQTDRDQLDEIVAHGSMSEPAGALVQHARSSAHDALPWERHLRRVKLDIPLAEKESENFLASGHLRNAVHALAADMPPLRDATFFNQFRGLHQIPEILVREQNDHIEQAISDIRAARPRQALEHMAIVEALFEPSIASIREMADTLTTDDYHRFRKHLGLTSGSHSEQIRHRLFIKNYRELWNAVAERIAPGADASGITQAVQKVDAHRHDDDAYHLNHELLDACQHLHNAILRWRDSHLHLAKNTLGSGGTKSLIGSPDAVAAVTHMLEAAHGEHDPMRPLLAARGIDALPRAHAYAPLEKEEKNPDSFIARIADATGQVARARFPDVQERSGRFSPKGY